MASSVFQIQFLCSLSLDRANWTAPTGSRQLEQLAEFRLVCNRNVLSLHKVVKSTEPLRLMQPVQLMQPARLG